jgi:hypothetical protein
MPRRAADFESAASASSATRPVSAVYHKADPLGPWPQLRSATAPARRMCPMIWKILGLSANDSVTIGEKTLAPLAEGARKLMLRNTSADADRQSLFDMSLLTPVTLQR